MAYLRSAEDIYNEMVLTITDVDTSENSWIYNALMPGCMKLSETLMNLDESMKKGFASSALVSGYSFYLEQRCAEMGVYRKQATYAVIPVKVIGKAGTVLKEGSIVSTLDNRLYTTSKDIVLDENGTGNVTVTADKSGSIYNVKAGDINYLPIQYNGIISVTNEEEYKDAYDEETDQALYDRYNLKIQTPATSGNKNHYKNWCLEVTGCGYAEVIPLWNGNGTVKCIIASSNHRAASQELINDVFNHIEEERPIGPTITVVSVEELQINLSVNLVYDSTKYDKDELMQAINKSVSDYLKSIALKKKYLSIAKIGALIFSVEGIDDYDSLLINGAGNNIPIADNQIAVLNEVVINES